MTPDAIWKIAVIVLLFVSILNQVEPKRGAAMFLAYFMLFVGVLAALFGMKKD